MVEHIQENEIKLKPRWYNPDKTGIILWKFFHILKEIEDNTEDNEELFESVEN